jgi:hypothetical protein
MSGAGQRQLRVRVLDALERRVKGFRSREELWPLRAPAAPLRLEDVVEEALGDAAAVFDLRALRARTLLHLAWDGGEEWDAWAIALPSKAKVYCDSDHQESRVLASGGRNEGDESDRLFLQLLAESGGELFGIEMSGGAPSRVRSSISDRAFLVEFFVNLFEVIGAEESVRAAIPQPARGQGRDFLHDVEEWLETTLLTPRPPCAGAADP